MKYEEIKIDSVYVIDNDKLAFTSPNEIHFVNKNKPIKISKLHIATDKYNL